MYSFTNQNDKIYIHILCGCGRKYKAEEMYICYNCKKVLCAYCLSEEIEYCYCKNNCQRNKCISVSQAKKFKNRCDQCLECPNCQTALVKKIIDEKYLYACNYCLWDTSQIKFVSKKENDIEGLIYQLKETNIKGYLKKNYDLMFNRLKATDEVNFDDNHLKTHTMLYRNFDPNEDWTKSKTTTFWEGDELEKKLKGEEEEYHKKMNLDYQDNYIQEHKSNMAFQAVANFLSVNLNYLDKGINKIDSLDVLRERLKTDYDISMLAPLDQRLGNVSIQHPITHVYFPQFIKLLPKKSKRCKSCNKFIVQVEDYSKKLSQKFELCHLFINQLPYCTISKNDFKYKILYLKFVIFDYKEAKISFSKSENSEYEMTIPDGKYEVSDTSLGETGEYMFNNTDPYIISKSDRCIVLKFSWGNKRLIKEKNESDIKNKEDIDSKEDKDITKNEEQENNKNKEDKESIEKISNLKKNHLETEQSEETEVRLRFTCNAEFFRLENQNISYEYEIKVTNIMD